MQPAAATRDKLVFDDNGPTLVLLGHNDSNLKLIERELGVELHSRGGEITIIGEDTRVALVRSLLEQLYAIAKKGRALLPVDVARAAATIRTVPRRQPARDLPRHPPRLAGRQRAITPKGLAQKRYVEAIRQHDIVFGIGPAGTGKTYLAMAMAVARAARQARSKRIILTRPAVEAGEKLGFLPGDLAEKVNPYLRPLYDALHDMMDFDKVAAVCIERGIIEVAPLAFMRGRTLNDSFVILDEAQNTTSEQMKMFLTRLGYGSQGRDHRRRHPDRPADRPARSGLAEARDLLARHRGHPLLHLHRAWTSCAIRWCRRSSRPTIAATPSAPPPRPACRRRPRKLRLRRAIRAARPVNLVSFGGSGEPGSCLTGRGSGASNPSQTSARPWRATPVTRSATAARTGSS